MSIDTLSTAQGQSSDILPSAVSMPTSGEPFDPPFRTAKVSTMRKKIGQNLLASKLAAPHFYLSAEVKVDAIIAYREKIKAEEAKINPTLNDFIIRAVALALKDVPDINAQLSNDELRKFNRSDVAFAVAIASGLVAPVIRAADSKSLFSIAEETATIIERARNNKLSPDDYRGGTFTVSNLGGFRVREFIAIINRPQAGILAIGRSSSRPILNDGRLEIETVLIATLSADHRVIDGATGARFLEAIQDRLETPTRLLN